MKNQAIHPYQGNPYFWTYKGQPTRLLGGSVEDNLFQIQGLEAHLNLLQSVGGNYIRCTMSSRDVGDEWPYKFLPEKGVYDLDQFNDTYWQKFRDCLDWTLQGNIIVQIEVWDRFDFSREFWQKNPFNPKNNCTYTTETSGLEEDYPEHPGRNQQPFFYTVPACQDNKLLLGYQQRFVEKLLSISLEYPNVLYCMDNETNGSPEWGAYWAAFIQYTAQNIDTKVYLTEMWDQWDITHSMHNATFEHPEMYEFVDVSQNNHISGESHWVNMQSRRSSLKDQPRPMNMVKIYGADGNKFGHSDDDAIARFWRGLLGGMASIRFHRPPSGLGLGAKAQANIHSARALLSEWDWVNSTPDAKHHLFVDREEDGAYLSAVAGKQYVVYFPRSGQVKLDLGDVHSELDLRWLNPLTGEWMAKSSFKGGGLLPLSTPGQGHWVAFLQVNGA